MRAATVNSLARALRHSAPDTILGVADALSADPVVQFDALDRSRLFHTALRGSPYFTADQQGRDAMRNWIGQHTPQPKTGK